MEKTDDNNTNFDLVELFFAIILFVGIFLLFSCSSSDIDYDNYPSDYEYDYYPGGADW